MKIKHVNMQKIKVWPKHITPEPDMHKLEGEFFDDYQHVFAGHQEYRPDCVTHSGMWRRSDCECGVLSDDPNWFIDRASYGLPGDAFEDAIRG